MPTSSTTSRLGYPVPLIPLQLIISPKWSSSRDMSLLLLSRSPEELICPLQHFPNPSSKTPSQQHLCRRLQRHFWTRCMLFWTGLFFLLPMNPRLSLERGLSPILLLSGQIRWNYMISSTECVTGHDLPVLLLRTFIFFVGHPSPTCHIKLRTSFELCYSKYDQPVGKRVWCLNSR